MFSLMCLIIFSKFLSAFNLYVMTELVLSDVFGNLPFTCSYICFSFPTLREFLFLCKRLCSSQKKIISLCKCTTHKTLNFFLETRIKTTKIISLCKFTFLKTLGFHAKG